MTKKIIIPTDFSIDSLNIIKSVIGRSDPSISYDIILLHGVHLSDSISELLFFSKENCIASLSNEEFNEACLVIKNKYDSQIRSIRKDIFTGSNQAAFENYLDANKVEIAFIPSHPVYQFNDKRSFDLIPYMVKSSLPVEEVTFASERSIPEKGSLVEVFFNRIAAS